MDTFTLGFCNQNRSQSKISKLDIHIFVQKEIPRLQVSMDHVSCMHILDRPADLDGETPDLWQSQAFSLLHHIHHRTVWAEFKDYIGIFFESEGPMELDNAWMTQFRMYLKFCAKLFGILSIVHKGPEG